MARKRRNFDPSFKLAVVKMVKEQGLSVQHVSESIEHRADSNPSLGGAVRCRSWLEIECSF